MRLSGFLAFLVSLVAALCACLGGLAPAASAVGTYTVNICNGMNDPPPIGSLTDRPKNLASEVNCPQGRLALATVIEPVHVEVDGTVGWRFNAPPDTVITRLETTRQFFGEWFGRDTKWQLRIGNTLNAAGVVFAERNPFRQFSELMPNPPDAAEAYDVKGIVGQGVSSISSVLGCTHPLASTRHAKASEPTASRSGKP